MATLNLNKFAIEITKKEGKTKELSIAQVKEVIKLVFLELQSLEDDAIVKTIRKQKP